MKSIYKYPLSVEDKQVILMPVGAEILTIQIQGTKPCLWALIDVDDPRTVSRHIVTFGTGHRIDETLNLKYISTYQMMGGGLVFHAFESI